MSESFLASAIATFAACRARAERAIAQVDDDALHREPASGSNSIAVIVQHLAGNLLSRWTDFLTTDGEKPDRRRDAEFEDQRLERAALMARWDEGWETLFATLSGLGDADLARTVHVRGEPHTVARAILRQVEHYGYHVGQIVYLARLLAGPSWRTISVPRGGSADFNERKGYRPGP